jgi:SNF2 family DNA or RNA helicase
VELTDEVRQMMKELTSVEEIPLPEGLNARLRPYQHRGFSWMYRNSRIGFGSIIADDMGLGKTVQVISILLKLKEEKAINDKQKALVVVPTGLLTNWQAEIARFAPSLSTHIYHGTARDLKLFDADVMLTTYGVARGDSDLLRKQKWQVMVIDEAQNIKNHDAAQSKAIKSIPANIRIAMSGTPVENRLSEFWSIMDFTNKGYLGSDKWFREEFATPIQLFNDEQVVQRFRKITSPFMMRRMKTDKSIISDLPDKVEQNQFALLTRQQAALYEQTMQAAMNEIEGYSDSDDSQTLFKRQGLVLQMILALKQICNHPALFLKNGNWDPALSGKVQLLFELLDSMNDAGEKVLIFTQFREMGAMLEKMIAGHLGDRPLFYHGGCSITQRREMVERFQTNRADRVFILSLKAAGTGLNLTAASQVVHFDLWWNPAVENQATDRAYRIGQKKNVMVHRMITKNSFEEKIDEMIQRKKQLADMTVSTGENWIGKLSNKELREIFG